MLCWRSVDSCNATAVLEHSVRMLKKHLGSFFYRAQMEKREKMFLWWLLVVTEQECFMLLYAANLAAFRA